MNTTWVNFYEQRMGESYHEYFKIRYAPFIDKIKSLSPRKIVEEGVGIASVSRCLIGNERIQPLDISTVNEGENIRVFGFDINPMMIKLADNNCPAGHYYQDDILYPRHESIYGALSITHGVLEHFNDDDICTIFNRYSKMGIPSIHYVPLDKYIIPSFGDERLLPYTYWLDLVRPNEYEVFNDGYDLWFYKKQ